MKEKAFSTRIWQGCLATQELLCVYIGLKLGLYEALAERAGTAQGLAARLDLDARYTSEWLEQQATAGVLRVEDGVYRLPEAHRSVIARYDTELSRIAGVMPIGGVAAALPKLLDAFRDGGGVPDAGFGKDWQCGHAEANRYFFEKRLVSVLRETMPDIYLLMADEGGTVVDLGCGTGGASLALARAFPMSRIVGLDVACDGLSALRDAARAAGLADRIATATALDEIDGPARLVLMIDTLHEVGRPADLLTACRAGLTADGAIVVIDALVADTVQAPGSEIERFQATTSVLHCLPAARSFEAAEPTGTMLRRPVMARLAAKSALDIVGEWDLEDRFHRMYRLAPATPA